MLLDHAIFVLKNLKAKLKTLLCTFAVTRNWPSRHVIKDSTECKDEKRETCPLEGGNNMMFEIERTSGLKD